MHLAVALNQVLFPETAGFRVAAWSSDLLPVNRLQLLVSCDDQSLGLRGLTSSHKLAQALSGGDVLGRRQMLAVQRPVDLHLSDARLALLVHLVELVKRTAPFLVRWQN